MLKLGWKRTNVHSLIESNKALMYWPGKLISVDRTILD